MTVPVPQSAPAGPDVPDGPAVPTGPDVPSVPVAPDVATGSAVPDGPTGLDVPGGPHVAIGSAVPDGPTGLDVPGGPHVAIGPAVPDGPVAPDVPTGRLAGFTAQVARHPRHLVLAALVVGLLLGPRCGPGGVLLVAGAAGVGAWRCGVRRALAGALITLVVVGAVVGVLRVRVLEHTALTGLVGHVVRGPVTILQAPRAQPHGGWVAQARYHGEPVLLRQGASRAYGGADAGHAYNRPPVVSGPGIGEVLQVRVAVRAPDRYAQIVHAHAVLRVLDMRRAGQRRGGVAGMVDTLRRRAERALARGPDPVRAALLQGMVLGQDAGLPPDVHDDVRDAGLSHLTAASGANVVLLATMTLALAGLAGVPFHARWLVVLGLIALYVPLAGGGPSILRAGVMSAAGVVAVLAGRPASRWYALGAAALVTLAADPRAAAEPGWQMSFAAVVALIILGGPWATRLHGRGLPRPVAEAMAITAAATLATAPIIAARFGAVAPLSLPANLLVAPLVAPIMWLGFTAAALGQILPVVAVALDLLADPLLHGILTTARMASSHGGGGVHAGGLVVALVCACLVACAGVGSAPRARGPGGRRIALSIPALLMAVAIVLGARALRPVGRPPPGPVSALRVTFLDVGQGDATLLQVPGHAMLVDAGPPDSPLLTALDHAGVHRLDALVITHAQADHDGGAAAVLAAMPVGLVLDGRDGVRSALGDRFASAARARRTPMRPPRAGMRVRAGRLTLRILSPGDGPLSGTTGADPNQRAIVAEADADGATVLLTADAESDVLDGLDLGRVDVLKVSHHGSADPGLPDLLERLDPLVAGIEVGTHNTYGHPSPLALRALRVVPRVVRTDRDGSVRLDRTSRGWVVQVHQ